MSGGHFEYLEHRLPDVADEIEILIYQYKQNNRYSAATLDQFEKGAGLIRLVKIYMQRIDYLVSGDDGEETFHKRLEKEIEAWMNDVNLNQ